MLLLTSLEARVLAVLVEKERLVPDSYPLSLNTLQNGCNQKSNRQPVMEVSEADVQMALDQLRRYHLVSDTSGGRVMRYVHHAEKVLALSTPALTLICQLILRGPQTAAELRSHSGRWYDFADISTVEAYLVELSEREQALTKLLPRAPGSREARWAHLLSGEPDEQPSDLAVTSDTGVAVSELAACKHQLAELSDRVTRLEGELAALQRELGVTPPAQRP